MKKSQIKWKEKGYSFFLYDNFYKQTLCCIHLCPDNIIRVYIGKKKIAELEQPTNANKAKKIAVEMMRVRYSTIQLELLKFQRKEDETLERKLKRC